MKLYIYASRYIRHPRAIPAVCPEIGGPRRLALSGRFDLVREYLVADNTLICSIQLAQFS